MDANPKVGNVPRNKSIIIAFVRCALTKHAVINEDYMNNQFSQTGE